MRHDVGKSAVLRNRRNARGWNLNDEKIFLDHLGTRFWSRNTRLDRPQMLQVYINTIGLRREVWTPQAKKYAMALLQDELIGSKKGGVR